MVVATCPWLAFATAACPAADLPSCSFGLLQFHYQFLVHWSLLVTLQGSCLVGGFVHLLQVFATTVSASSVVAVKRGEPKVVLRSIGSRNLHSGLAFLLGYRC